MQYKAKIIQQSFNTLKKYLQQHLTHSYHLRPMIQYVKLHNVKTHNEELFGIEIGTHQALNAYSIMQNLPMRKLYLIDPYTLYDDGINTYQNRDRDYEIAQQRMKPFENNIEFIKEPSEVACKLFQGKYKVDFVYIDGNHSYDYVKKDIELYYPFVKSGGVIGGHDFRADCEGLCRAVLEFADKNKLKLNGWITDWWLVKP
jgi:hypothetical protein